MNDYQTLFIERKEGKNGREEAERREGGRRDRRKRKKGKKITCKMPSSSTARMARTLKT